jgi:hypothetical protein
MHLSILLRPCCTGICCTLRLKPFSVFGAYISGTLAVGRNKRPSLEADAATNFWSNIAGSCDDEAAHTVVSDFASSIASLEFIAAVDVLIDTRASASIVDSYSIL